MVHPHLDQPSSPTPNQFHLNIPSLIPSPPPKPRNQLIHGSSTRPGHVTASGLAAWRRGTKPLHTKTPVERGSVRKVDTTGKKGGSSSGKLGMGMGMQGTPARRKKARTNTHSIGSHSTPKASTRIPSKPSKHTAALTTPQSTSSSIPLSSLPSFDDVTSDDIITGPKHPEPVLGEDEMFTRMRQGLEQISSDAGFTGEDEEDEEEEAEEDETIKLGKGLLFTGEEMVVPLNDFTETTIRQSRVSRQSTSVTPTAHHPDPQTSHLHEDPNQTPGQGSEGDTQSVTNQDGTTHWSYMTTVYFPPENTTTIVSTNPQDTLSLTQGDMEFSIPLVNHSQENRRTPSKATSKIRERRSTPYKTLEKAIDRSSTPDVSEEGEVEISRTVYTPRNRSSRPSVKERKRREESFSPVLRSVELPIDLDVFSIAREEQHEEDESDRMENEVVNSCTRVGSTMDFVEHERRDESLEMEDFDPGLEMGDADDYVLLSLADDDEPFGLVDTLRSAGSKPIADGIHDGPCESDDTYSTTDDWDFDIDFGFARAEALCKTIQPEPYIPSSQITSSKLPSSPSSSTIIFSPTPSLSTSSRMLNRLDSTSSTPPLLISKRKQTRPTPKWQGAAILARMQEGMDDNEDDSEPIQPQAIQRQGVKGKKGSTSVGVKRKNREGSFVGGCELTKEAMLARKKRIAHYKDLEQNYSLHIELVWG